MRLCSDPPYIFLFHPVIKFSHPLAEQQIDAVHKVLSELDATLIPKLMVWNKVHGNCDNHNQPLLTLHVHVHKSLFSRGPDRASLRCIWDARKHAIVLSIIWKL